MAGKAIVGLHLDPDADKGGGKSYGSWDIVAGNNAYTNYGVAIIGQNNNPTGIVISTNSKINASSAPEVVVWEVVPPFPLQPH